MNKYFGKKDDSTEFSFELGLAIDTKGWILMSGPRPTPEHIATNGGEWVLADTLPDTI
ncbi:TPA: hypothetical protein ACW96C_003129 [Yersinia enterocolitica]|uniref:hypothetical protein n=1 Tax=Yersinia mollaretii TaxID=33060 RepID=UPI0002DB1063|nr:hypothetical protein [Yersinia mollaretii]EKN3733642.1 hypothetical protein [Yersinia enterocolitica]QKJ04020.1 hypothetical protein HRD69_14035 [Yersinia mollaretii ATCC 43969]HDM8441636.1 hypothetical protein [Yersinia enterocolitica]HDV0805563.1 hypothetical protein [Yersinia enterocolitica]HDZ9667971.1 hypothetical protein [Yersinia enterocolitica]